MCSKISYHVVQVPESCGRQVDRVALFATIIVRAPFFEVTPDAGINDVFRWLQRCLFLLGVHRAGYLQPRE